MIRYQVRYRLNDGQGTAGLIVTAADTAYLFSDGTLQGGCSGPGASQRLAELLARHFDCQPVLTTTVVTMDDLRRERPPSTLDWIVAWR